MSRQTKRGQRREAAKLRPRLIDARAKAMRRVIEAYAEIARPIMLGHGWRANTCIAATRVTLNVLETYGIKGRPLCVIACVYAPGYGELQERLGHPPSVEEQVTAGIWSVGLGAPREEGDPEPDDDGYNGHLVALVADDTIIIDGSLDQAARPEKGIVIGQGVNVVGVTDGFFEHERPIVGRNGHGVTAAYWKHGCPPSWEDAPDWGMYYHSNVELAIVRQLIKQGVEP